MYENSEYTWLDLLPLIPLPFGRMKNGKLHWHSWAWDSNDEPSLYCGDINCDAEYHPKKWMLK